MSFPVLKIFAAVLMFSSFAFANEGGGEGGHGGAAPAEKKVEIKSSEDSYAVVQARVQALEAKVRSAETEIQKLLVEKQHSKDPQATNEIIRQMLTLHKEMEKNLKEYDQQRSLLKYRYPEKGGTEKREYERIELKSLEDMETQMSLGSSVKRTLKKVRMQYGTEKEASAQTKHTDKAAPKVAPPSITDPVILKK